MKYEIIALPAILFSSEFNSISIQIHEMLGDVWKSTTSPFLSSAMICFAIDYLMSSSLVSLFLFILIFLTYRLTVFTLRFGV